MATVYKVIKGDWMRSGYLDNPLGARRGLVVVIVDGLAYDADGYGHGPVPLDECRLTVGTDRQLRAWGHSTSFAPDAGEIERVGLTAFKWEE